MKTNARVASILRSRITIEHSSITSDEAGGYTTTWGSFAEVWAEVVVKAADERFDDEQTKVTDRIIATIRYLTGVTAAMRINYDGKLYNIQSILNPYNEDVLLEIQALEQLY